MKPTAQCLPLVSALLVAASTLPVCAQGPSMRVISEQQVTTTMRVLKDGKPASVESRNVLVGVRSPDGRETNVHLLVMREPQTGVYWWTYQEAGSGGSAAPAWEHTVFFTADRGVGFMFETPFLLVRETQGRAATLAAAQEAAIADLQRNIQAVRDGSLAWGREINVTAKVGRDFLFLKNSASPVPQPGVASVARAGAGWEVRLEGPNKDAAILTLDERYEITGVRREPAR
jgi:hypothetical protein